jgi:hypothetical protein
MRKEGELLLMGMVENAVCLSVSDDIDRVLTGVNNLFLKESER